MRLCMVCGKALPPFTGVGRKPEHCATERCTRIHRRTRKRRNFCPRCGDRIGITPAAQRFVTCGSCFVDQCDVAGLERVSSKG